MAAAATATATATASATATATATATYYFIYYAGSGAVGHDLEPPLLKPVPRQHTIHCTAYHTTLYVAADMTVVIHPPHSIPARLSLPFLFSPICL